MKSDQAKQSAVSWVEDFERRHVRPSPGRTLIIGSRIYAGKADRRRLYENVIGVDMQDGEGVDLVKDLEHDVSDLGKFDHVECISVLEHSRQPWVLAKNIGKMMNRNATLFLSVPFVWRYHGYPNDYWRFSADGVRALFPFIQWHNLVYASNTLRSDAFMRSHEIEDHPHLPRCEVIGFGKRA